MAWQLPLISNSRCQDVGSRPYAATLLRGLCTVTLYRHSLPRDEVYRGDAGVQQPGVSPLAPDRPVPQPVQELSAPS